MTHLEIEENVCYEVLPNGPGCDNGLDVSKDKCYAAAETLGFKTLVKKLNVGSWEWSPPGCHVGHGTLKPSDPDNWKYIYFNNHVSGTLDRKKYKSICKKKCKGGLSILEVYFSF